MNNQPRTVTNRRIRRATVFGLTIAAAITGTAIAASAHQRPDPSGTLTHAQRKVILEATAAYRDPAAAIAAGYIATDVCVELPGVGGMGYHYVHPQLVADTNIDPTLPEVLVYAPDRRGRPRLAAIEYLRADADGDLATDGDRPTLFAEPFEGPMEGHEPGMPVHYDLHAWVWKHNPAGELAAWNPAVDCP